MSTHAEAIGRTEKRCPDCDTVRPLEEFHRHRSRGDGRAGICADCTSVAGSRNRRASLDRYREVGRENQRKQRAERPESVAASIKRNRVALRNVVFDHYGWTCRCCGSAERPTIDHVNGDGGEHRKRIGEGGHTMYLWLIRNGFPDGFQTLCLPCNTSKHRGDHCRLNHAERSPDASPVSASLPVV